MHTIVQQLDQEANFQTPVFERYLLGFLMAFLKLVLVLNFLEYNFVRVDEKRFSIPYTERATLMIYTVIRS